MVLAATMYALQPGGKETALTADATASDTTFYLEDLTNIPAAPNVITIKTSSILWERCRYTARVPTSGNAGYITVERSGALHASSAAGNAALAWSTGSKVLRAVMSSDFDALQSNVADHETRFGVLSGYNYLINPAFEVNQEQNASVNSSGAYPVDDWSIVATGSTFVGSQQAFTLGQTSVPGEPKNYMRIVTTSVADVGNFIRIRKAIESVRTLAGRTVTVSWYGKADASKNISIEFIQNFGTGGSPSSSVTTIGVAKKTLTSSWALFSATATIPSISGKTIGSDGNDCLELLIWLDAGSNFNSRTDSLGQRSGTFEFANFKLEEGSVATPFIVPRFDDEYLKCQRYYTTCNGTLYYSRAVNMSNLYSPMVTFPIIMRTIPLVQIISTVTGAIGFIRNTTSNSDVSAAMIDHGPGGGFVNSYDAALDPVGNGNYMWKVRASARL